MATDANKNAEMEKVVRNLINVLQDSQKGFADIGEHLKRYSLTESYDTTGGDPAELVVALQRSNVAL
jgi:hypothetical protein